MLRLDPPLYFSRFGYKGLRVCMNFTFYGWPVVHFYRNRKQNRWIKKISLSGEVKGLLYCQAGCPCSYYRCRVLTACRSQKDLTYRPACQCHQLVSRPAQPVPHFPLTSPQGSWANASVLPFTVHRALSDSLAPFFPSVQVARCQSKSIKFGHCQH